MPLPVVHLQGNETAVVVAMAKAGVVADTGRGLTATAAGGGRAGRAAIQWPASDGGVHHAAGEIKPTIVEVAPQVPDALRGQVRLGNAFVVDDCGRAARETIAIASAGQRGFKERLRCEAIGVCELLGLRHSRVLFVGMAAPQAANDVAHPRPVSTAA